MKITVQTLVKASLNKVWDVWNNPADINRPTSSSGIPPRTTGTRPEAPSICAKAASFLARMEAKDGSEGFDFEGTYTRILSKKAIEYRMSVGREVKVEFVERPGGVLVKETFDAETENTPELQRQGWQAILDNFGRHVEAAG